MKISVIIPIYNSVSFLEECLCSIKKQTFNDWECILVDDGSDDGSGEMCDEWVKKDSHFRVIHKENGGVSKARNVGLAEANGEYVLFVDSDDFVRKDYVTMLMRPLEKYPFDMVLSGLSYYRGSQDVRDVESLTNHDWELEDHDQLLSLLQQPLITSPVAKLYKKSVILRYNLQFDEDMSLGEDRDFNIEYISKIQRVCSICYNGYLYRRGVVNSLTTQFHDDAFKNDLIYWRKMHDLLGERGTDFQVHRLFFFIADNLLLLLKQKGLWYTWKILNAYRSLVNRQYLIRHMDKVMAPNWQKRIMRIIL